MKINKNILVFAVIIGLLTVLGLSSYLKSVESKTTSVQIEYSKVVVANTKIPKDTTITADMVTLKSMPSESVHSEAITSIDKVVDTIAEVDIVSDEQILSSKLIVDVEEATLAYRIPENMRAMSIPTSEITGVAGYINKGDSIDILVTYQSVNNDANAEGSNNAVTTYTQLQNIEVVAVNNAITSESDKNNVLPASITVIVNPKQAEVLAYALVNGTMHYTLRNPLDESKVNLDNYNTNNFTTYKER